MSSSRETPRGTAGRASPTGRIGRIIPDGPIRSPVTSTALSGGRGELESVQPARTNAPNSTATRLRTKYARSIATHLAVGRRRISEHLQRIPHKGMRTQPPGRADTPSPIALVLSRPSSSLSARFSRYAWVGGSLAICSTGISPGAANSPDSRVYRQLQRGRTTPRDSNMELAPNHTGHTQADTRSHTLAHSTCGQYLKIAQSIDPRVSLLRHSTPSCQ